MNKIAYKKIVLSFFIIFFASLKTAYAMEVPTSECVSMYETKIDKLSFIHRGLKAKLQETVAMFRRLLDPDTTWHAIAEPHYQWWLSSSFSRWEFYQLRAIFDSGVLCQNKFYTIPQIIKDFENLLEGPDVSAIAEKYRKTANKEELKQKKIYEKQRRKEQDTANHLIREALLDSIRESEGADLYTLYQPKITSTRREIGHSQYDKQDEEGDEDYTSKEDSSIDTTSSMKSSDGEDQNDVDDQCLICFSPYKLKPGTKEKPVKKVTLVCNHSYCQDCVRERINIAIADKSARIMCPSPGCGDLMFESAKVFQLSERKTRDLYKNILDTEVARRKKYYVRCSNTDCAHIFYSGKALDEDVKIHWKTCPYCDRRTCMKCHETAQSDHICRSALLKQREDEKKIREEGIYMDCPYCGTWHDKNGCSYVTCSHCKNCYDFATGGPWDAKSAKRQQNTGKGYHSATKVNKALLIKSESDFVDGKDRW